MNELTTTLIEEYRKGYSMRELSERYKLSLYMVRQAVVHKRNVMTDADREKYNKLNQGVKETQGTQNYDGSEYEPVPLRVLKAALEKPERCSPARWRMELSRRALGEALDLALPPDLEPLTTAKF